MANARSVPVVAAFLFFAFALLQAVKTDHARDFFIFRLGAELAARGQNPYDVPKVQARVAGHYTADDAKEFRENCGYFLPPLALLAFLPFAVLPWAAAKVAWAVANGLAAYFIARLPLMLRPADSPPPGVLVWAVAPVVLVLNPLTLAIVFVGQFTVVFVGCVAAGLLAFERGKPYLAALVWTLPFVKPHLAIPLIPLAWYLGGWRPAAALVALVGVLNLAGAWVAGGSPLFLKDYFEYLPTAREVVAYNRVEMNPTITSWNRLLYAAGGPLVELGAVGIVAGYLVWFGLAVGRCAVGNVVPSAAWAAAVCAAGGVLCAQVLVYELLFLAVAVPWTRDLFASGHRPRGWLAVGLLAFQIVPLTIAQVAPHRAVIGLGFTAYHSFGVALFALLVLAGPVAPREAASG